MKKLILLPLVTAGALFAAEPQAIQHPVDTFKIGLAGFTCHKFTIDETLEMMKQVDLKYLCIKDFHLPFKSTDEDIAAFKQKLADAGVTGYAIGPIYSDKPELIDRDFEFAKRVGVDMVVGVPVKTVDGKKVANLELLQYINDKVKATGIKYAIHNHGPDNLPYATAEEIMGYIKDMDKNLGICLDIGHNARSNEDPFEAIRKYADRIHDMHWKNVTDFSKAGKGIEVSRGKLDYPQYIKTLRKVGYSRVISLEYEKDMDKPLTGIAESMGYIRGVIDALQ